MNAIAGGFLFFYLGVTLLVFLICCTYMHPDCCWCTLWSQKDCVEERIETINDRIVVNIADCLRDFSLRKSRMLTVKEGGDAEKSGTNDDNQSKENEEKIVGTGKHYYNKGIIQVPVQRAPSLVSSICECIDPMSPSHVDSTKTCPICIEEYKIGEDICYSKNRLCPHVFHAECMKNWLMNS
eukprot:737282_1